MLSLLVNHKDPQVTAFSELGAEISELDKYWREVAESTRQEELEKLRCKLEVGVQELTVIANKINSLANEIKNLLFTFKEIAVEVNRNYHLLQQHLNLKVAKLNKSKRRLIPLNIWDVHDLSIPNVVRRGTKFILTKQIVNLFPAQDTQA
ncbi:hypothetical protein DSM106972_091650 [Dulcicalothrix desertica PCC 7102]|uniref:Uncharacterized protein n=1 Tax=Dulcicalothrix desertica PCC 7102 TaxID=232991 RepID=A0A3S1CMC1_9CYAN|nr:hypothetical protein [Dulcicalothrix desertica]RUS95005.1 hypothetical protein DSM106972_091650 [Dulcicalothrix desertica PCC 7102]